MKINNKGTTLLEMAIGILLTGVIVSSALSLYLTQHKHLLIQDQVSDMQSSVRAAMGELTNSVRMAGCDIPASINCIIARDCNPDTIILLSNRTYGIQIEHAMPTPSAELRCDGHDLSPLHEGDTLFIYDPYMRSGEFFYVTQIQYASSNIQHNTMNLGHSYPQGSRIIWLSKKRYYIDSSNPSHSNLMVQVNNGAPQVFAENITDLQFKYVLSSRDTVDVPIIADMVRNVIISVTARSDQPDPDFQNQYRTRTLTTTVKVRNLGVN